MKVVDEIVDFISQQNPGKLMPFEVSEEAKKRVYDLVFKEKSGTLTKAENSELKYYLLVEHIMRLAKAKAYKILS